ncbi:MAG: VCBS repeat-containing protein [Bacteroidota bacterium]|nr:VCBS repeat-containing protein [Bacteroidota bacterium]
MTNPLVIEQNFQTLKQTLRLISSSRLRILQIVEFIENLLDSPTYFPAYAPELLPQLVESINKTDFIGTNLNCLERCIKLLKRIESDQPAVASNPEFTQAQQHLKAETEKIRTWIKSKNLEGLEPLRKKFVVGSVWIPMVEREQFLTAVNPEFASLQKLNIEAIFSKKEADADKLHIKQLSHKEESQESELLNTVEAAISLLGKFAHIKNGKGVTINCSFNNPTFVEGQSLQAGLAAGLFTELLHLHQFKEEYAIREDIAITGRIDKQANLLPVDETGLRIKVEACYFSHIRYIIVPKEQVGVCQSVVDELTVEHSLSKFSNLKSQISNPPSSSFDVIGISNLAELFYNRKFSDSRRISVTKQTARNIWKQRRPIAAVTFVVLLFIIGKMWYGPLDKNPVAYAAEGEMLILKNKYGEVLDEIKLGGNTIKHYENIKKDFPGNDLVSFIDLDTDELNEVVFTRMFQDGSSIVYCKSLKMNKYLWEFELKQKLIFPRKGNDIQSDLFHAIQMAAGDFDKDGNPEIIVLTLHNGYFPCIVFKLDAKTGKELGNYLHIGNLYSFKICDIDNNGIPKILLTGISNAFDIAVFTILDPRFIYGHSPLTKDYVVEEYEPAAEKAYIVIPRTVVGNYYSLINKSNSGKEINIDQPKQTLRIVITDYVPPHEPDHTVEISFFFGFDLRIKSIGTHDLYDLLYRKLFKEGKISQETNFEYFENFKKEILYWDGDKFVNYPTLNKRYVEAVAALDSAKGK